MPPLILPPRDRIEFDEDKCWADMISPLTGELTSCDKAGRSPLGLCDDHALEILAGVADTG